MVRVSWIKSGTTFRRMEGDISNVETLPVGIYEVNLGMDGWSLTQTSLGFTFNYKIYNLQRNFIDYVEKTYKSTKNNLGILFTGTRGTGKSVAAKILANELNLPVIIVKSMGENNQGLISYLSSFNFDCIFFFDEFEKQFNENDCSILQFMDGVYTSVYRRVFLLTTNDLSINENLLSRPSRIRYVREFGNLEKETVVEYLKDNLKDASATEDLISYIDTLTISTIDILKAIVEEVNIHGIEEFLATKSSFNVKTATFSYRGILAWIDPAEIKTYGIEKFLEEATKYKHRYTIDDKYRQDLDKAKSDEEKDKIRDAYIAASHRIGNFDSFYNIPSNKPWNKLIPGKDLFRGAQIVKVDEKHKVIITVDDYWYVFHLIENSSEKPSLYNETQAFPDLVF